MADVLVDGVSKGAMLANTFSQVDADHTFAVSFAINTYTISASTNTNGSISPNGVANVNHGTETLAYIAWEPSMGMIGDTVYRVDRTADAVKHKNYNLVFDIQAATPPTLLADMQTTDGGDPANVRCKNKDHRSVDVMIDEEQSKDNEVNHTTETVGFMIFADLM